MSLREIARRSKVSLGTVQNVMAGKPSVDPRLKDRVLAAAREIGYEVGQRERRRSVIAVSGNYDNPYPSNPFNAEVMLGLFKGAAEQHADLCFLVRDFPRPIEDRVTSYLRESFDALIVYRQDEEEALLARIAESRKVVVLFRRVQAESVAYVDVDNVEIGRFAAGELISRGYDHYFQAAGHASNSNARDRAAGFEEAMRDAGKKYSIHRPDPDGSDHGVEHARSSVAKIKDLQRRAQTIGVFAWCDPLALEILRLGELNIPDNVGLLGCDGLGLAEPWLEIAGLSTIRQGVEDIASEGVRFAVDLTKGIPPAERRVTIDRWIRPLTRTSTLVTRR